MGVVLAGGRGRRIGGDKAMVALDGRPLLAWPLAALSQVTRDLAVVAKRDTRLPELPGVAVWREPDDLHHPLVGVVHALVCARRRDVLVCAVDLPLVTPELLFALLAERDRHVRAVVPRVAGRLQPLCALYTPAALPALRRALAEQAPVTEAASSLGPAVVDVEDRDTLHNVNAPEDLLIAAGVLARRR